MCACALQYSMYIRIVAQIKRVARLFLERVAYCTAGFIDRLLALGFLVLLPNLNLDPTFFYETSYN
jgi:hypothetical protein